MKQFMMFIRTEGDHLQELSPDDQKDHVQKVGGYIGKLMQDGKLKSAQPLEMEGTIITSPRGKLKDGPFNETKEVIAGYFLIEANDLQEAVAIAKQNPVLENEKATRSLTAIVWRCGKGRRNIFHSRIRYSLP
jgi:hypothetical protein